MTEKLQLSANVDTHIYNILAQNKEQQASDSEFSELFNINKVTIEARIRQNYLDTYETFLK